MRKIIVALCAAGFLFASCKEHDTALVFPTNVGGNGNGSGATDSSYVLSTAPAVDPHNVLIEEFTGQACPNCPAAHALLDAAATANPNRINIVSLYFNGGPQTVPPSGSSHDFRTTTAFDLSGATLYGGVSGLPAAGVDRTPYNGNLLMVGSGDWSGAITAQLALIDSVNLSVSSSFSDSTASIKVTVTYPQATSSQQYISVYVVEDNITDLQDNNGVIGSYLFLDVMRAMVSAESGDAVMPGKPLAKPLGQVYWKKYTYTAPLSGSLAVVPAHCRVVALVHNSGSDKRILQSAQCPLVP